MASSYYVAIKGKTAGAFKGESPLDAPQEQDRGPWLRIRSQIDRAELATGQAVGKASRTAGTSGRNGRGDAQLFTACVTKRVAAGGHVRVHQGRTRNGAEYTFQTHQAHRRHDFDGRHSPRGEGRRLVGETQLLGRHQGSGGALLHVPQDRGGQTPTARRRPSDDWHRQA